MIIIIIIIIIIIYFLSNPDLYRNGSVPYLCTKKVWCLSTHICSTSFEYLWSAGLLFPGEIKGGDGLVCNRD